MKKEKLEKRVGVRLSAAERQKLEQYMANSDFRDLSDVIRLALKRFLETA